MKLHIWIIILSVAYYVNSIKLDWENSLNMTVNTVKENAQQIVIFVDENNSKNQIQQQHFIQKLESEVSTTLLTIAYLKSFHANIIQSLPLILRNPRSSTLYIILVEQLNQSQVNEYLEYFALLSPLYTRPKCLLMIFDINSIIKKDEMETVLVNAWTLKYLDFSAMQVRLNELIVFYYNPFENLYISKPFNFNTDIFPNKLINLYQYSLKTLIRHEPPFCRFEKNNRGEIIKIDGADYSFLKTFSRVMNFKFSYTTSSVMELKSLNNNVNLMSKSLLQSIGYGKQMTVGTCYTNSFYAIIVPIMSTEKLIINSDIFVNLLITLFTAVFFLKILNVVNFHNHRLTVFDIFQILFNVSHHKVSQKFSGRLVLYLLIVFSMIYCSHNFAKMTDISMQRDEIAFDSWEDIETSGLPIYSFLSFIEIVNKNKWVWPYALKTKLKNTTIIECIQKLANGEKIICVLPYLYSKYLVNQYNSRDYSAKIKISKLQLATDYTVFVYETASPYIERFDQITQRIVQHGFLESWDFRKKYWSSFSTVERENAQITNNQHGSIVIPLSIIAISGYIISLIIFIGECLIKYTTNCTRFDTSISPI